MIYFYIAALVLWSIAGVLEIFGKAILKYDVGFLEYMLTWGTLMFMIIGRIIENVEAI